MGQNTSIKLPEHGTTYFIGLDLAFSPKNNSGIVILAREKNASDWKYIGARLCKSDEEISEFLLPYLIPGKSVVAVDAPLVVPNESGMRVCERMVGRKFGAKGCGAYPAHKGNMAGTRGPRLLSNFVEMGVPVYVGPKMNNERPSVHFMETYPHAGHLGLFGLPTIWKYKKKSGRTWDSCRQELMMYWKRLFDVLPGPAEQMLTALCTEALGEFVKEWLTAIHRDSPIPELIGVRYKQFEDLTDGLFCAYTAAHISLGRPAILFSPDSGGGLDLSRYSEGQDFIVVPSM